MRPEYRNGHIYLLLRLDHFLAKSEWIKTYDWNHSGFNFLTNQIFSPDTSLVFKRDGIKFEAKICWKAKNNDPIQRTNKAINQLLFHKLNLHEIEISDEEIEYLRSCKTFDVIDFFEKKHGIGFSPEEVEFYRGKFEKDQIYQYGVHVEDPKWNQIIADLEALTINCKKDWRRFGDLLAHPTPRPGIN